MSLQIPKSHIPAVAKIRQAEDSTIGRLTAALESSPPSPDPEALLPTLSRDVPEFSQDDLSAILEAIYALYYVREFSEVKTNRFVNDLIQAFRTSGETALAVSDDETERIKARFRDILSIEKLRILSKALRLKLDGERLYCTSKIISDIRPVFHDDVAAKPSGAVVSHTLKLEYHEGGDHKEFLVVLESADLEALKGVIERAQSKAKTLKSLLDEAGLQDLSASG